MKVAYIGRGYPEKRLIIDRAVGTDYVFIDRKRNLRFIIRRALEKICKISYAYDSSSIFNPFLRKNLESIDLIHSFNSVCHVKQKWVIAYESVLPRTRLTTYKEMLWMREDIPIDKLTLSEIKLLAKDNCARIIAISESAKRIEKSFLDRYVPSLAKTILDKTTVILPPQKTFTNLEEIEIKYRGINKRKLRFLFVGRHLFFKGGDILIDVLEKLHKNYDFEFIVVSNLGYAGWLDYATKEKMEEYKKRMESLDWITWYAEVPNGKVLELCKESDVGFLPSFNDSFGYSVLEMQACGCPVVSTNIRALKEINDEMCGWLCQLALTNDLDFAIMDTEESITKNRESLKKALYDNIKDILENPEQIKDKAVNSLKRIEEFHDPDKYSKMMNDIYNDCN